MEGIDKLLERNESKSRGLGPVLNIIEDFNPIDQNVDHWLKAVDEFAYLHNWSDQVICHLALEKLRGPAETWYRGLPTRLFTWPEWKDLLTQYF